MSMKEFKVTISSPADDEEHIFEATQDKIDKVAWTLLSMQEPGAWFKIERTK